MILRCVVALLTDSCTAADTDPTMKCARSFSIELDRVRVTASCGLSLSSRTRQLGAPTAAPR